MIEKIQPGKTLTVGGVAGSGYAHLAVDHILKSGGSLLFLAKSDEEANSAFHDFSFYSKINLPQSRVILFPELSVNAYSRISPNPEVIAQRLKLYHQLTQSRHPNIVIASIESFVRKIIPKNSFTQKSFQLSKGDVLDRDEFIKKLTGLGYQRVPLVEDFGNFSVRGGIVDYYSPSCENPTRVEFLGDSVEIIKVFNPANQKTISQELNITVIPVRECLMDDLPKDFNQKLKALCDSQELSKSLRDEIFEHLSNQIYFSGVESCFSLFHSQYSTILDYLPTDTVICFKDVESFVDEYQSVLRKIGEHRDKTLSPEKIFRVDDIFVSESDFKESLSLYSSLNFVLPTEGSQITVAQESNDFVYQKIQLKSSDHLLPLVTELNQKRIEGWHLNLVCSSLSQKERLCDLLNQYKLPLSSGSDELEYELLKRPFAGAQPDSFVHIVVGDLSSGFLWQEKKQWWITDEEIFGKKSRRRPSKKHPGEVFSSFEELSPGDLIVHVDHGIGRYNGLIPIQLGDAKNDFLLLEYLGGDKLYVPVDKLNRVYRYASQDSEIPPLLDKLGGTSWINAKEKVKKAARRLAKELLELQAMRATQQGYAFSPRTPLFEEFEATFPYEETNDQLQAIEDVIKDMERERPTDRLVCGDVGFGKTEVAIRAAFKAVLDHKQVLVLVPTTVLAFQHYETFKKRFANYPVNVEMLSRFRSATEQKKIVADFSDGKIDIIIGTHRLLSKDVTPKDLGLLVIDEEHRFGVAQKEKIKKIKNLVHVITLTATPIPRTLNFAMVGIRDLSLINTPPEDRLSIQTLVVPFEEEIIRDAIMHEIQRGGQVFFLHNRVQSIEKMQMTLSKIVPQAKIVVGHGQMSEDALEDVMIQFMDKKADILLCTAIIESGLDIPSANTIIINRADTLGLAQLYQLRGRVGRSNLRAYCYLVTPHESLMTTDAKKRLRVIQKFTELGAGFKIASHDLEIRGAGNILGPEQTGHIAAIGYDLYTQLLKQAVDELNGKVVEEEIDPELKLDVIASIPESMVPDPSLRLVLYKQISSATNDEELFDVKAEWIDRFGKLPESVLNLIELIRIKVLAHKLRMTSITKKGDGVSFLIHPSSPIPTKYFLERAQREPKKTKLFPDGQFLVRGFPQDNFLEKVRQELLAMGKM